MRQYGLWLRELLRRCNNPGFAENEDIEQVKIFQLTSIFGFIGFVYLVLFGVTTVLAGNPALGSFDITMGILSLLNILLLRWHRRIALAADLLILILATLMLYLFVIGAWSGQAMAWGLLFPLVAVSLKGAGRGTVVALLFLATVVVLYFTSGDLGLFDYGRADRLVGILAPRLAFIYLAVLLVSFSFVRNRHALYEEIKRLSLTDSLTLLPNRRSINGMLEHLESGLRRRSFGELAGEEKKSAPTFAAILCDIDGFKEINDTHGHQNGDLVLQQFSALLKERLRGSDFVGRWGGEEFLILLEATDLESAKRLAAKLVTLLPGSPVRLGVGRDIFLTMSCGVGCFDTASSLDTFIRELDNNLYLVKNSGKNGAAARGEIFVSGKG